MSVNVALSMGCVMSPWLFTVYMDGVIREVNSTGHFGAGFTLSSGGGRFQINQPLFADNIALVPTGFVDCCKSLVEYVNEESQEQMLVRVKLF